MAGERGPAVSDAAGIWQSDIRPTLALGLPLVGAQLAQMAINTTDVLMIGWLGAEELAASVLAFNINILIWFFGMGVVQAVIPLAAKARGQNDLREMRRSVRMGIWIVTLYCLPAWCLMYFTGDLLVLLGQDPKISVMAGEYMRVLQWAMLPALLIVALRVFLTVMEMAKVVLAATIVGALVNAFFDYALIFGNFGFPRLELVGAGLATVGSSLAMFLFLVWYVMWHRELRQYNIFSRIWRSDWPVFFQICKMGWPISVTIVAEAGLFAASAIMIGWIGTLELAAHGIALQLASITFMIPVGLSQAAMTRVGLAAGRGDREGVGRAGWSALFITVSFMALCAIMFWVVPEPLVALYLDFDNPQAEAVMGFAVSYLAVAALFQLVDGGQIISINNLRGLGDTQIPLYFALVGYWVIGISLSLSLGFVAGWDGVGVWSGLAGGLGTVAILANYRFYRREALGLLHK